MKYRLEQSSDLLVTHTGMALVGALMAKTDLKKRLNWAALPNVFDPSITHADIIRSYIGLLCQGKSDFEHIEQFRDDYFFKQALRLQKIPSSPTLRQRLDMAGTRWEEIILEESANLLNTTGAKLTPCVRELLPLDIDVSPFDNSKTKKEGISRTYKGVDGYAPIFAYLGVEGYGVHVALREGKDHSQNGSPSFIEESIQYARRITEKGLLVRLDSGFDSSDNILVITKEKADFIIKRNPRKESLQGWLRIAEENSICCLERAGKKVFLGDIQRPVKGVENPVRLIFKVTERTIKANGQILLTPEIEVDTYWTSLSDPAYKVIELYQDHGTSEQFHSEIKSELDLERLPSGKFATNDLVLHIGLMAYNILRFIGQESLKKSDSPLRKKVQRRRIRTVIQNLMTIAAKLVRHARRYTLCFGRHSPWFNTFQRVYDSVTLA